MWAVIYFCCLLAAGYPAVAGLARGRSRIETLGLAACVGPGIVGVYLIFLSMLGLRPQRMEILFVGGAGFVASAVLWRRNRPPVDSAPRGKIFFWWTILCAAAMAYGLFAVTLDALGYPVIEWDAFAIWQLKAQVLTLLPLIPRPAYFSDLNLSFSHLRYPLLEPMMSAGMHAMTGRLDSLPKALSLLFYPGMGAAVFAVVRRFNGITAALTATALLACSRPMFRYGGSGTADMALTAFYACSLVCVLRWRQTGVWGYVVLAGLLSAWMAWTKDEGLALAAINVMVVAVMKRRRSLAAAGLLAAIVVVIYLPWIIYSWGLPRTDENYAGNLSVYHVVANFRRIPMILGALGLEMINWQDWGIFWLIVAGMAIVQRRRLTRPIVGTAGVLLVLHLLIYFPPLMVVTSWNLNELLAVTTDRLLMHIAPAAAILIGLLWPSWAGGTAVA